MSDRYTLHHGDMLTVLGQMPEHSVDVVLTDPPYGLSNHTPDDVRDALRAWAHGQPYVPRVTSGFLGSTWDSFVPGPEAWRECLRVLKPGGHLLVFAGTRTHDLMGLAVRLAGFDLRDTVMVQGILSWVHGQGFPKSLNVSKQLDNAGGVPAELQARELRSRREAAGLTREHLAQRIGCTEASIRDWEEGRARAKGKSVEWVIPSPEYRSRLDAILGYSKDQRLVSGEATARFGDGTQLRLGHSGVLRTGGNTDLAAQWDGWGTALKPSFEPVLVFRKPLEGTVAANVLKYGTGALNIDGTRITTVGESFHVPQSDPTNRTGVSGSILNRTSGGANGFQDAQRASIERTATLGRWPPNVAFCHLPGCKQTGTKSVTAPTINRFTDGMKPFGDGAGHPYTSTGGGTEEIPVWDCAKGCMVRALDEQSGEQKSGEPGVKNAPNGYSGNWGSMGKQVGYPDEGGASRYFPQFAYDEEDFTPFLYTAKASKSERNEGLDGQNQHPTVKPLDLMRWIAKLVTPPGGTVLDPFMGSGTTGCAAMHEGFTFVGIEQDPGYFALAQERIAHHANKSMGGMVAPRKVVAPTTPEAPPITSIEDLFGLGDDE